MQSGYILSQESLGFSGQEHMDTSECNYLNLNLFCCWWLAGLGQTEFIYHIIN